MTTVSNTAHTRLGYTVLGALVAVLCTSSHLLAANLTWNPNGNNNGSKGNIWNTNHGNWAGGRSVFSNTAGDDVTFGPAGVSTVRIGDTLTPNNLTISTGQALSFSPLNSTTGVIQATGAVQISGSLTLTADSALHSTSTAMLSTTNTLGLTVNNGGSLILAGTGNHIGNQTNLTLSGGTIQTINSGVSEAIGALTLSATSALDFSGTSSSLTFSSISSTSSQPWTLNVFNWTPSSDSLFVGSTAPSNVTVNFYSGSSTSSGFLGTGAFGTNGEMTPVPEPSTILAGLGIIGFLGWRERRRISSLINRNKGEQTLVPV